MTEFGPPFDEAKLALIREFLKERFGGYQQTDRFDFETTAQRFRLVEAGRNKVRSLSVPKGTIEDPNLGYLLNDRLVDALKLAGAMPVTLTSQGPQY